MPAIENTSSFGYWIRRRRKALDLTQADLATKVGCSLPTIKKIESDERRPSILMAERLADCLEIAEVEKETFIKIARQVYSPERFAQKRHIMGTSILIREWVNRIESNVEHVIGDALARKNDPNPADDDPSGFQDFGA